MKAGCGIDQRWPTKLAAVNRNTKSLPKSDEVGGVFSQKLIESCESGLGSEEVWSELFKSPLGGQQCKM